MEKIILAIETSCDETAVAILRGKNELLANVVSSQIDTHQLYGGVVPEIASRLHVENISLVLEEALKKAKITIEDVDAIAVTQGPGLIGSLHVGMQAAKTLALMYDRPLIGVHHIAGHIYASALVTDLSFPLLALVVSGGHTELVYMKDHLQFEVLGMTQDDAIGEAYDKVARVLGLSYPGGPAIDQLAQGGQPTYDLPVPKNDGSLDFSFSGLKSAVLNLVNQHKMKNQPIHLADLACSFQTAALTSIVKKTVHAALTYQVKQIVLAGGVAANSQLRAMLKAAMADLPGCELLLPPLWCCTDNAAMIAAAAYEMLKKNNEIDLIESSYPSRSLS